jgi:hypothetical protein
VEQLAINTLTSATDFLGEIVKHGHDHQRWLVAMGHLI